MENPISAKVDMINDDSQRWVSASDLLNLVDLVKDGHKAEFDIDGNMYGETWTVCFVQNGTDLSDIENWLLRST